MVGLLVVELAEVVAHEVEEVLLPLLVQRQTDGEVLLQNILRRATAKRV